MIFNKLTHTHTQYKEIEKETMNTRFLSGKPPKSKHPWVEFTTTGKANPIYEKDIHTQGYQIYGIHLKLSNPSLPSG